MREVEFRAKDIHFNKWVYGYYHYLENSKEYCILEYGRHTSTVVDEQTVGQYTGLKDKNGTKIYEGDIFEENQAINVVVFKNGAFRFKTYGWGLANNELIYDFNLENDEIIGNVYDNPELIERFKGE